ncbi:Zein-binding domain-containing protein [Cynara cardunculus var. scolymus]|uniref:Zein-binding domain-containing protein n=1 Tax=Cynara cardunculus var. scolymus TaxID=59895 RepID=A0A103XGW4_CYNCS|nr:Zein-binding domain-containing protein [Cynara cardunculus var. scolymus]
MESDSMQPSNHLTKGCECGCNCCDPRFCTGTWIRSVKRKLDELEVEKEKFMISGILIPQVAHVELENECGVLREMVNNQQQSIHDLSIELEEERKASSSAANEAMSMILRLQRVKAEIEMEARQFKRFSEEKTAHDQQEIAALEDLLYKREQTIQSLTCEVQAYKYRMMSYGFTESEVEGEKGVITSSNSIAASSDNQFDYFPFDYPPLKCHSNEQHQANYPESSDNETVDIDKYTFEETPRSLKDIEQRINELERSPKHSQPILDKLIVGHSPRKPKSSRFSMDGSTGSFFATIKEDSVSDSPRFGGNIRKMDSQDYSSFKKVDNGSEFGDEMSDRIYTVDSIHYEASYHNNNNNKNNNPKANMPISDDFMSTPKDSMCRTDMDQDPEVMKLYARLHALEADRESMRQAIINMRTDKAQLVLLKEIAQHLCKEVSPTSRMPVYVRYDFKESRDDGAFRQRTSGWAMEVSFKNTTLNLANRYVFPLNWFSGRLATKNVNTDVGLVDS